MTKEGENVQMLLRVAFFVCCILGFLGITVMLNSCASMPGMGSTTDILTINNVKTGEPLISFPVPKGTENFVAKDAKDKGWKVEAMPPQLGTSATLLALIFYKDEGFVRDNWILVIRCNRVLSGDKPTDVYTPRMLVHMRVEKVDKDGGKAEYKITLDEDYMINGSELVQFPAEEFEVRAQQIFETECNISCPEKPQKP